ncbi:hypothetical protein ACPA9J_12820 [Pseudomonas aeruginosa]
MLTCGTPAAERAPPPPAILSSRQRIALRLAWRFLARLPLARMLGGPGGVAVHPRRSPVPGPGHPPAGGTRGSSPPRPNCSIATSCCSSLLVLGLAVGTFVRFYLVSWIGERFVADIRKRVFDHLIELHPGFSRNQP